VLASLETLIRRAHELGISRQGFEGTGPHETGLSRDVAAGLFVAWRALRATGAFVVYSGAGLPEFRRDVHRAWKLFRGSRPDGLANADSATDNRTPVPDRRMAVEIAGQAIRMSNGIGYATVHTQEDVVAFVRLATPPRAQAPWTPSGARPSASALRYAP
jgi:hypothetical protein